jgi:RHS repeat-associated protein
VEYQLTPQINAVYSLDGLYDECYDPTGEDNQDGCSWSDGLSGPTTQAQITPSVTLAVSNQVVPIGNSVTFTASIDGGLTGTITLYDGSTVIGTGTISGSTATFTLSTLALGNHSITAYWPSNGTVGPLTSNVILETVYLSGSIQLPSSGVINTVAGDGLATYSGDSGAAVAAGLHSPTGIAVDSSGNIYIADTANNRIRKVTASTGNITTVAGNGTAGYSGDGSLAVNAELNNPTSVAVDSSGNLYIADGYNNRIRKVTVSSGNIATIAGNGTGGFSGDGGAATSAELYDPADVALDTSGNIYIEDVYNSRIRKVTVSTGKISTIAGNGTAGYSGDGGAATSAEISLRSYYATSGGGIALDSSGNIYIADINNNRVRKVTVSTGVISTIAGNGTAGYSGDGGAATSAELHYPSGVWLDSAKDVYIADFYNDRIREVSASTSNISTVVGNGTQSYAGDGGSALSAELYYPTDIVLDSSGNLYIADEGNNRIRIVGKSGKTTPTLSVATSGTPSTYAGSVTFTATISSGPTGSMIFYDNGGYLGMGTLSGTTATFTTSSLPIGTNSITASWPGNGTYNAVTSSAVTQTVNKAILTVTANNASRAYGSANPTFTPTYTGFVNGDTQSVLSGAPSLTTTATSSSAAGSYAITASVGTLAAANYTFSFVNGTLTVSQVLLTVTANNASRGYGSVNPTFTPTYTGFVNGDTQSVLSGAPSLTTTATPTSALGNYTITAAQGTLAATSYTFAYVNGTLTINMATPTITWATPAAIPYGTPLSSTQLNASMNTAGTCYYTPDTGIVLEVGTQTLAVDCVPNDMVDYNIPAEQTVSLTVSQSTPSIWISNLPASAAYGQNFGVNYSYSGDGTTSVVSNTTSICTVSGDVVSFVGLGTCSLTASATGTANYLAVTGSAQTFTVSKDPPAIWINNIPTNAVSPGGFTATYDYPGNGTPSITPSTNSVCTVSGNTVTYTGTGVCTLTASASATTDYAAATGDSQSFTIGATALQANVAIYSYTASYDGVGNVIGSTDTVNGSWNMNGGYDALNRLALATQTPANGSTQYYCWAYDDFGNRLQQEVSSLSFQSGSGGPNACNPQLNGTLATDLNSFTNTNGVDPGTNQIQSTNARGVVATPGYDASGDMLSDGANTYVYDAEGRVCAVESTPLPGNTVMTGYIYDAEGTRVAKGAITSMSCDPATNGFTMTGNNTGTYVLDQGGQELTQLSGSGAWQRTNVFGGGKQLATYDPMGLHFQIEDALGTRRMQTNADGQPETDILSLPYGDQLSTPPDQYAPATADDATPLHFTGKERDTESGNDYFGARYYESVVGRWLSPDWSAKIMPVPYAKLDNPQSLNLYAYVFNNPLKGIDLDGHMDCSGKNAQKIGCQYNLKWDADHGISPNAKRSDAPGVPVKLPNGKTVPDPHSKTGLLMSPTADLSDVASAGKKASGDKTRIGLGIDLAKAVGTGGEFDYQRMGPQSDVITGGFQELPQFRDVSNFNVGLYTQQAGMSLTDALKTAGQFAQLFSRNYSPNSPYGLAPQTAEFIRAGWEAGASGAFDAH